MGILKAVMFLEVAVLLAQTGGTSFLCPKRCDCTAGNEGICDGPRVYCNHKNFHKIPPSIPTTAVCLYLKRNFIKSLSRENLTTLSNLRILDLSENFIYRLSNDTFRDLHKLYKLILDYNKISFNSPDLPAGVFEGLQSLSILSLERNKLSTHLLSYRDDIFRSTPSLTVLSLDGLPLGVQFGQGFKTLKSLKELDIYGLFNYICNDTFEVFSNSQIGTLRIQSRNLYDLEPDSFSYFKHLTYLSLSSNPALGFNASKAWYGLRHTNIMSLELASCTPTYLGIYLVINETFFRYLNETNIKRLVLDRNSLRLDFPAFHTFLPNLTTLSLLSSKLMGHVDKFMKDIDKLHKLKELSLTYKLKAMSYELQPHMLQHAIPPEMTTASITHGATGAISLPKTLEILFIKLEVDARKKSLSSFTIKGTKDLQYIGLYLQSMRKATGPLKIPFPKNVTWKMFSLKGSGITHLSQNFLNDSIKNGLKIEALNLAYNELGKQLGYDETGTVLSAYKDLLHLNLSLNGVRSLPQKVFKDLVKLQSLNLSSNSLRSISFGLMYMVNLENLDLSANLYTALYKDEMGDIDTLHRNNSLKQIDLSDNPFICSCDTLDFLQWMQYSCITFHRYYKYSCMFQNKMTSLKVMNKKYMKKLAIKCSANNYVIAAASSASTAFIVMLVSIVLFRHRWDIKFFIIRMIAKGRKNHAMNEDNDEYQFDAFVAYHEDDKEWVVEQMVPNLEGPGMEDGASASAALPIQSDPRKYISLCLHFRDFDCGTPITENIVEGITNSRKTILVLSNSFVESHWCRFEIEMARMKCFDEGRNSTIVIMLEKVDTKNMTGSLKALIKRYSYLTWPVVPADEARFWSKLRESVASNMSMPCICECGRVIKAR